ncbi:MAG TPA: hypothetical protein VNC11_00205 [Gemmatimonadaceae bacterium]|jgi:hypothetical protein|nr:hypothetical protein [Gemmatimonadaceae bacterium]
MSDVSIVTSISPMNIRVCVLTGLAVASFLTREAVAQSAYQKPPSITPVGVWRGTSVCLVRPSACKDEVVVYRITRTNAADTLSMDARKIVNGGEQEMGVLTCSFAAPNGSMTCSIPNGTWQFRIRNDSLVGELRVANNKKFRDVRARRSHDRSP